MHSQDMQFRYFQIILDNVMEKIEALSEKSSMKVSSVHSSM
jgi:hypothetical protein